MAEADYLFAPDQHLDPLVAASYDRAMAERFSPEVVGPAVELLSQLAQGGPAVEFAVGTGRLAVPLGESGVDVYGVDLSEPMLAELRAKPGSDRVALTLGDMTEVQLCTDATLVYLVFNTITNLRTQQLQLACFRNAAAHLVSGGRFVVENGVPGLHQLAPGQTIRPFDISEEHLGFDEYIDTANQISISHHYYFDGEDVRRMAGAFRYVWPSELDLMAQLAGMELEARWADWHQNPFTGRSQQHVSVWRRV
ncbi:MAG: class I SAM-dependent methyltransferase [Actinomycetia bacterium]|nr:class I SAM-dependent methyltransferase [Actinomycetes bacterium]MCP4957673.1 class I SAM-dependent methyltransferase [Actinomycetes bacterium]